MRMQASYILLSLEEHKALITMCEADCRPPKEELRWLLRREAERRGLLRPEQPDGEIMIEEVNNGTPAAPTR